MNAILQRYRRAVKNPRLIAFVVCCLVILIFLSTTLILENDNLVLFAIKYSPFLAVSTLFVMLMSPLAAVTLNIDESYILYYIIACGLLPWLLSVASAILGTIVKKQWHIVAIVLFCFDLILSLVTLRIIAVVLDLALLILVCTTSSSTDFWDV